MSPRAKISLILLFVSVCCTSALVTWHVRENGPPVEHRELYDLVCSQLRAFRRDDFSGAYHQASRNVQQQFSLVEFRQVIRTNYSAIAESYRVELGPVRVRGNRADVQVFFIGESGGVQPCIYSLIYEAEKWKIDGARFTPRWPAGMTLSGART